MMSTVKTDKPKDEPKDEPEDKVTGSKVPNKPKTPSDSGNESNIW